MKRKVLVVGPYGRINFGDDLIAYSICEYLLKKDFDVTVTNLGDSKFLESLDVKYLKFPRLRKLELGALKKVKEQDLIIIGGGQQLQEPRFPNPVWGLLANSFQFLLASKFFKKRYIMLGVGVDRNFSKIGKSMMKYLLKNTDNIVVRDNESYTNMLRFDSVHDSKRKIKIGTDLVFLKPKLDFLSRSDNLALSKISNDTDIEYIMFFPNLNHKLIKDPLDMKKMIVETGRIAKKMKKKLVVITSDIHPNIDSNIYRYKEEIEKKYDNIVFFPLEDINMSNILSLIKKAEYVISARMHPMIMAILLRTKFYGIITAEKMKSLLKKINIENYSFFEERNETFFYNNIYNYMTNKKFRADKVSDFIKKESESIKSVIDNIL